MDPTLKSSRRHSPERCDHAGVTAAGATLAHHYSGLGGEPIPAIFFPAAVKLTSLVGCAFFSKMKNSTANLIDWKFPIRFALFVAVTGLSFGLTGSARGAGEMPTEKDLPPPKSSCNSICQLHAQDWAFALLIETYREYRCNQIEVDYANRTRAVARMADAPNTNGIVHAPLRFVQQLQELLGEIAAAERNRGLQLVHTQVNNFQSLYDCARKDDELTIGATVAKTVDNRTIAQELKKYVVLKPDLFAKNTAPATGRGATPNLFVSPKYLTDHAGSVPSEPASTLLYDEPAVPVDPNQLLTPCE